MENQYPFATILKILGIIPLFSTNKCLYRMINKIYALLLLCIILFVFIYTRISRYVCLLYDFNVDLFQLFFLEVTNLMQVINNQVIIICHQDRVFKVC